MIEDFEVKYDKWKSRRHGKITSSVLPKLMQAGKGCEFGTQAMREIYFIKYERRTGLTREGISGKSLDWGTNNEPVALEWLRSQFLNEIKSCSKDFDEIVFNEPFPGFGDSPDFYMYGFDGEIEAVGEIKCPTDQAKIEELRDLKQIDEKQEYYWQFLGHFIGTPQARKLLYVIYDGYANEGIILEMLRDDHEENITRLTERIQRANGLIDEMLNR